MFQRPRVCRSNIHFGTGFKAFHPGAWLPHPAALPAVESCCTRGKGRPLVQNHAKPWRRLAGGPGRLRVVRRVPRCGTRVGGWQIARLRPTACIGGRAAAVPLHRCHSIGTTSCTVALFMPALTTTQPSVLANRPWFSIETVVVWRPLGGMTAGCGGHCDDQQARVRVDAAAAARIGRCAPLSRR